MNFKVSSILPVDLGLAELLLLSSRFFKHAKLWKKVKSEKSTYQQFSVCEKRVDYSEHFSFSTLVLSMNTVL